MKTALIEFLKVTIIVEMTAGLSYVVATVAIYLFYGDYLPSEILISMLVLGLFASAAVEILSWMLKILGLWKIQN